MPEVLEQNKVEQPVVQKPEVKKRKRRFGDRYDGYRVRTLDLPFWIIPNIMRSRMDSQILFEEAIDITELERYVRAKRSEDMPDLRLLHVVVAAMVRVFALRPQLNRFVAGKKIYAHNNFRLSCTVKRSLTDDGEETEILPVFQPTDTLADVVATFNKAWLDAVNEETKGDNQSDVVNRAVAHIPTWMKTIVVFVLRNLDKVGLMPKFIYHASPFHSSAYLTDVGSIGIDSVYHHLYEFGTTSCFLAMGKKMHQTYLKDDGTVGKRKIINFRFVLDERICDGHYYAASIKMFRRLIKHPELLEVPPESIPDEI